MNAPTTAELRARFRADAERQQRERFAAALRKAGGAR